jgi:putative Mg2+ transporter-C (MgtC) family protein
VVQVLSDLDFSLLFATINMGFALIMGAIIGSERQFRGRMAGLRTNALVSLGAAGFVTFAALYPEDINPTRVAAQVVSGIGFLGAGIIFRDGLNIQGINTAATLWCSAAVGLIAGSGHLPYAFALTALIVFSNLGLRPIVRSLKHRVAKNAETEQLFQLRVTCQDQDEKDIRASLMTQLGEDGLTLREIESNKDANKVEIIALVKWVGVDKSKAEQVMCQMSVDPRILRAAWADMEDEVGDLDT